jgi:hypothetical protein
MNSAFKVARMLTLASGFLLLAIVTATAGGATADDTAKLLAGMPPSAGSPLETFTKGGSWKSHARNFDNSWARLDKGQLVNIRAWSTKNITQPQQTLLYMFSGPDFLYANAFFPNATTYVLAALEPVGSIPNVEGLSEGQLAHELGQMQHSLNSLLAYSFFITKKMKHELGGGRLNGTLPVLYVFLARAGTTITDVSLVKLDAEGVLHPADQAVTGKVAEGAKIAFTSADGKPQTLYYFSSDVSNDGIKVSGLLKFCADLGHADSFVKSASYLMHLDYFSGIRDFLLTHSDAILQDDSGVPVRFFKQEDWKLQPFGNYVQPLSIFPRTYQPMLTQLFRKGSTPIDFGFGYHWRPRQSNLLLAVKSGAKTAGSP